MTATPNIIETNLEPLTALSERRTTDMIVIHHTGEADIDASAEQIDQWHKSKVPPWAMIGYHFVIRILSAGVLSGQSALTLTAKTITPWVFI